MEYPNSEAHVCSCRALVFTTTETTGTTVWFWTLCCLLTTTKTTFTSLKAGCHLTQLLRLSRWKLKSVDNSRIFNAFALTARMDNVHLHPGCRCALPWAMCFCAYSACWSMVQASSFPAKLCIGSCKALRWLMQSFALAVAKLCVDGCKALRLRWAKLVQKSSVLFW